MSGSPYLIQEEKGERRERNEERASGRERERQRERAIKKEREGLQRVKLAVFCRA